MTAHAFIESIDLSEAQLSPSDSVINGVVLIRAGKSANRRYYSEQVLSQATPIFEGVQAYANHPSKDERKEGRDVTKLTGWYKNVRFEAGAIRADRYFSGNTAGRDMYAIAKDIVEGRAPKTLAGLSIVATGQGSLVKNDDGEEILNVEAINAAQSVDDVATPAAGGGYIEATAANGLTQLLIEELTYDEWFHCKPDFIERLQKEMKKVRQDDALKDAQAEAEALQEQINTLTAQVNAIELGRDAALSERDSARRDLLIEQTLAKATRLPHEWRADLREQLHKTDMQEWDALLNREIAKAKRTGAVAQVPVSGAGYQEHTPPPRQDNPDPKPRDHETVAEWMARTKRT